MFIRPTFIAVVTLLFSQSTFARSPQYADEVMIDRPVGYWRFEDPTIKEEAIVGSALASDVGPPFTSVSNMPAVTGIYHGGVTSIDGVPGIGGQAIRLDGDTAYVEIPHSVLFETNSLTVEFWFLGDQPFDSEYLSGSRMLVSKAIPDGEKLDWMICAASPIKGNDQGRLAAVTGPEGNKSEALFSNPSIQLNDGRWHHVVFTRSAEGKKCLYVDGQLSSISHDDAGSIINDRPIHIGGEAKFAGSKFLRGAMDEVAIYSSVLPASRVASHFFSAKYGNQLPPSIERRVDFVKDVQPIFREHCYDCHSQGTEEGGLDLSVRARVLEGGDSVHPILAGSSVGSPLIHLVAGVDTARKMPPKDNPPLSEEMIGVLRAWIDQGAQWPDEAAGTDQRVERARNHWALRPIQRTAVPTVQTRTWVRNDIDAFVLSKLEKRGSRPAAQAEPLTLLRRAYFDLVGLPPSAEQVLKVAGQDASDFADSGSYKRLIDELLESKHYGERYARYWLDVVRYADSAGYELDTFYNHAWRYRDYVIEAFNSDKPFDRFVQEQIAGDEMWPDDESIRFSTGLLAVGPYHYESGIARPEIPEYKWLTDTADTIGSTFMGLTVGCARCHSHKFDSISQKDYFGLHAILSDSTLWDTRIKRPPDNSDERRKPQNWIVVNRQTPPLVRVLHRGELKIPGIEADPAIFRSIQGGGPLDESDPSEFKLRRTKFALWLTSKENPLTARVIANRVWQWHFGEGLVRTPNDFGTQGSPPTHPELLDYLATELMANNWSLKHLHRLIMRSNTYQMQSKLNEPSPDASEKGSELAVKSESVSDFVYSRFPRRRMEAETIWDNLLSTAGTINLQQSGEPVLPPINRASVANKRIVTWQSSKDRNVWSRRGIYVMVRRALKFPFFETFNINETGASCALRDTTVVSPQALTMLNDDLVLELSQAFAGRLIREAGDATDTEKLVRNAWTLVYSRPIEAEELGQTVGFLGYLESQFSKQADDKLIRPTELAEGTTVPAARGAALVELCRALFNSNEFLYID